MRWRRLRSLVRRWGAAAVLIGVILGLALLAYRAFTGASAVPKVVVSDVVQLKLVALPPPPPPPPPPPKKMIDQPRLREPLRAPEPQPDRPPSPKPSSPTPPGPLALATKGQGPADAFALGGNPNGSDTWGGGGGGGGSPYGWYSTLIEQQARDALQNHKRLKAYRYEGAVQLWLKPDGSVDRAEVVESTGNDEVDRQVIATLTRMPRLPQPPPAGLPQPVVIWVSSS